MQQTHRYPVSFVLNKEERALLDEFFTEHPHLARTEFIKMLLLREIKLCNDGFLSYKNDAPLKVLS